MDVPTNEDKSHNELMKVLPGSIYIYIYIYMYIYVYIYICQALEVGQPHHVVQMELENTYIHTYIQTDINKLRNVANLSMWSEWIRI